MKKEIILIIFLALVMPLVSAGLFDWLKEKVQLAPAQPTDVRVQVRNIAPTIENINSIPAVNLNPAPSTTSVIFTFTARDRNSAADLNDATASANFSKIGEQTRTSPCTFQSQPNSREKIYQCTVNMQYYDDAGTWSIGVNVQDQGGLVAASSSSTFTVNLLRDITLSQATINFPSVAPEDVDIISTIPTTIANNGNFEVPVDGNIRITAFDLQGETTLSEIIPASNFRATGNSGIATVCSTGTPLVDSIAVSIPSTILPRGPAGSNTEDITNCITLVPIGISNQFYSATGGRAWIIGI